MLTLPIYPERPILVEGKHQLRITNRTRAFIVLEYLGNTFQVHEGDKKLISPNIQVHYLAPLNNGASIGFNAPKEIKFQKCVGKTQKNEPIWYGRNSEITETNRKGKDSLKK